MSTQAYADAAIGQGSQSFAAASRLFDRETREDVAKLYAWCRHCDDVVDGQEFGHGRIAQADPPTVRLDGLEVATRDALEGRAVEHPAFRCLADVAAKHVIPPSLPFDHLRGFRMDVEERRFATLNDLLDYCYGVAGVVGVMMTHVMLGQPARQAAGFETILDRACDLGLAFQLTNIARDVVEDARAGRVYLPLEWLAEAGVAPDALAQAGNRAAVARVAVRLVEAAEPYYASARIGVRSLPFRAAWAVDAARGVYRAIGRKVVTRGVSAWDARARTSRSEKLIYLAGGGWAAARSRAGSTEPRSPELWTRPR